MGGSFFFKNKDFSKKKKKKRPDDVIVMSSNVHIMERLSKVHCMISMFSSTDHQEKKLHGGGHLYFRLDIILIKGLSKHTLNTSFSGMKIDPNYAFLQGFS